MTLIDAIFLFPLVISGVVASYFDIKKGVVPNKIIVVGFLVGIFLYLGLIFANLFLFEERLLYQDVLWRFINGVVAVLAGYFLWHFKFWSAGDGKLFGLYGFLLPLTFYSESYINYFPSFNLLVNLFIPLLFIIFLKAIVAGIKRRREIERAVINREFWSFSNLKKYSIAVVTFLFTIGMVMIVIRFMHMFFTQVLEVEMSGFVIFGLLLLIMFLYNKLNEKIKWTVYLKYVIVIMFFGSLLVQQEFIVALIFFRMIVAFAILVGLLKQILLFYVKNEEVREVRAVDVKEGMVLTKDWERYFSQEISKLKKNKKDEHFKDIEAGGLTKKQAEIIRDLFKSDEKYKIQICSVVPFAPFMFLGMVISVFTSSSFMPYINSFFSMMVAF